MAVRPPVTAAGARNQSTAWSGRLKPEGVAQPECARTLPLTLPLGRRLRRACPRFVPLTLQPLDSLQTLGAPSQIELAGSLHARSAANATTEADSVRNRVKKETYRGESLLASAALLTERERRYRTVSTRPGTAPCTRGRNPVRSGRSVCRVQVYIPWIAVASRSTLREHPPHHAVAIIEQVYESGGDVESDDDQ